MYLLLVPSIYAGKQTTCRLNHNKSNRSPNKLLSKMFALCLLCRDILNNLITMYFFFKTKILLVESQTISTKFFKKKI